MAVGSWLRLMSIRQPTVAIARMETALSCSVTRYQPQACRS